MRWAWFLTFCVVSETLIASPLPKASSPLDSFLSPASEDDDPRVVSGAKVGHQQPPKYLGGVAKIATALTTGYIGLKTLQSQRARDTLASLLGLSGKNSKARASNSGGKATGGRDGGSDSEQPPGPNNDNVLAKIEREYGHIASDEDPTMHYPEGDHSTQEQRDVQAECYRIKYNLLSGPEKYAYRKDDPRNLLDDWHKVCRDPERAKRFVETYRRQNRQRGGTKPAGGFHAFESVRFPPDAPGALLAKLGAIVRSGRNMASRHSFAKVPGGIAPAVRLNPVL